jgi:hypothetical protein
MCEQYDAQRDCFTEEGSRRLVQGYYLPDVQFWFKKTKTETILNSAWNYFSRFFSEEKGIHSEHIEQEFALKNKPNHQNINNNSKQKQKTEKLMIMR